MRTRFSLQIVRSTEAEVDASTPLTTDIDYTENTEDDPNLRHADVRFFERLFFLRGYILPLFIKVKKGVGWGWAWRL